MYTLLLNGFIQLGQSTIPPNEDNRDYQAYLAWLAAGNTPIVESLPVESANENYRGFYNGLLGNDINLFLFVRSIADMDLPVSNAYTDLMGAIQFEQFPGFQSSITVLFASLKSADYEFSAEQIAQMRLLLDRNGFEAIVFPLGGS